MSLQQKLDAFKADFQTKAPPAVVAAFDRSIAELIAGRQAQRALRVGDRAPTFDLPDSDGAMVSSAELLADGPLVVTFYRGVWCPYCNMDLQAVEAAAGDIRARGASLVAISQQTPANSRKIQGEHHLSFPILSDKGGDVVAAFGIRWAVPEYLREVFKMFKTDLSLINGEPSWTLPMPARYVIGTDGMIAYAEVNPDYTRRPDPSELLPTLERLRRVVARKETSGT
jgi:peroxiredoxin